VTDPSAYPCPYCQIGFCQPSRDTYTRLHKGTLVSVPNMLVWICDICQYQEFDREAVTRLETLLGDDPGRQKANLNLELPDKPTIRRAKP
jgi:hypothetical protein